MIPVTTLGYRDLLALDTRDLLWGFIEASVGVTAACIPTSKPLIHGRSADSMLQSVRSRLSLRSANGSTKRAFDEGDVDNVRAQDEVEK